MTGSRIIRGFRRLGIALAIPCFMGSIGLLGGAVYKDRTDAWREFPDTPPSSSSNHSAGNGPWNDYRFEPVDHNPFADLIPRKSPVMEAAPFAAAAFGLGILLFLGSWLVGWVFAGFTRDLQ